MTEIDTTQTGGRGWRDRAACRDVDPELFFPVAESGPVRDAQVAAAKAVCVGCPVRVECLAEALARIPYGIAGGLTEHERRRLHRAHPRTGITARVDEVLTDGPPPGMTSPERARVGRTLLAAGRSVRQVARDCGVSPRTVERWATDPAGHCTPSAHASPPAGERSRGGHRAPLRTFAARDSQAAIRAPEGI